MMLKYIISSFSISETHRLGIIHGMNFQQIMYQHRFGFRGQFHCPFSLHEFLSHGFFKHPLHRYCVWGKCLLLCNKSEIAVYLTVK
jgi:hypothetical protein